MAWKDKPTLRVMRTVLNRNSCKFSFCNELAIYIWIKKDQLDVTCFIISLFNAQHVSDVSTSILRSLRLMFWDISWVVLIWFDVCWCYVVVWLCWCGIRMQVEALQAHQHTSNQINTTHEITQHISSKFLRMDVLISETCWALNNEIIKQVTSCWSPLFNYQDDARSNKHKIDDLYIYSKKVLCKKF